MCLLKVTSDEWMFVVSVGSLNFKKAKLEIKNEFSLTMSLKASRLLNFVQRCWKLHFSDPLSSTLIQFRKISLESELKKKLFHIHVQTNCEKCCRMKKVHCGIECISGISEEFKFLLSFLSQHLSLKHLGNSKILLEFYFCEHF